MEIEFRFEGDAADNGLLEMYDAARALAGFQRSLALATHLVVNGEIITQAPSLQGAQIYFPAVELGSWRSRALVIFSGAVSLTSAGQDSPLGQVVTSVYDYALSQSMGFHVDYSKTLQKQYGEYLSSKKITQDKLDSLIEKSEASIADMHRPIVISETATHAGLFGGKSKELRIGPDLNAITYEYVKQTFKDENVLEFDGFVSSYNVNTFKGRIFLISENRPLPFELMPEAQDRGSVGLITRSQHRNGQSRGDTRAVITIEPHRLDSSQGTLKRLHVTAVSAAD